MIVGTHIVYKLNVIIKKFPKPNWFKFTSDTKVQFAMDNFHFKQAFMNLTTKKNDDFYNALIEYIDSNNKKDFNILVEQLKTYILND